MDNYINYISSRINIRTLRVIVYGMLVDEFLIKKTFESKGIQPEKLSELKEDHVNQYGINMTIPAKSGDKILISCKVPYYKTETISINTEKYPPRYYICSIIEGKIYFVKFSDVTCRMHKKQGKNILYFTALRKNACRIYDLTGNNLAFYKEALKLYNEQFDRISWDKKDGKEELQRKVNLVMDRLNLHELYKKYFNVDCEINVR